MILNQHFYRNVFEEPKPKPTQKQPLRDESSEHQTEEPSDNNSPLNPLKPKTMKTRELAGLGTSHGDAWKPPAASSRRNCAGKDMLAESAQWALVDEEIQQMISMYSVAAISNDHDHEDAIEDPMSYQSATEYPLLEKWDMVTKEQLQAMGQHQVYGDFVELPEGRKALPSR
jgi:hypothetical protein